MILKVQPKYVTLKGKSVFHRLAHALGLNRGEVITFMDLDERIYVGFKCSCGDIFGVEDITERVKPKWVG